MDLFVSALENYPIQSGIILIGLGIIYLIFRVDNQKKESYKTKNVMSKVSVIQSWGIISILLISGIILIIKGL
ncbi:hypothetical protein KO506_06325 [Polaribacter vadi]|uniref:hypothetical protein n=1 Tax=Polaribacter TaxID=52959 RepID=UPI001C095A87|nr:MULTISPECIES: hypothetical protein [Polaribacter]MBU3011010.1 hypothetical protein [Polaribacter vadi]MDO6740824.1 hypothetical protein [Polaribacter sp. 1_MG-2023]